MTRVCENSTTEHTHTRARAPIHARLEWLLIHTVSMRGSVPAKRASKKKRKEKSECDRCLRLIKAGGIALSTVLKPIVRLASGEGGGGNGVQAANYINRARSRTRTLTLAHTAFTARGGMDSRTCASEWGWHTPPPVIDESHSAAHRLGLREVTGCLASTPCFLGTSISTHRLRLVCTSLVTLIGLRVVTHSG